jgi:hypothetical protein
MKKVFPAFFELSMNKILLAVGMSSIFLSLSCLCGCVGDTGGHITLKINKFDIQPHTIKKGESANLSWDVTPGGQVFITNGIDFVWYKGYRIVFPTNTTTYLLRANNGTHQLEATTTIVVNE